MSKISREAGIALMSHKKYYKDNTVVSTNERGDTVMKLFGNTIAIHKKNGELYVTLCGWDSRTTKTRLCNIPKVYVRSQKGSLYINNTPWNGKWCYIIHNNAFATVVINKEPY